MTSVNLLQVYFCLNTQHPFQTIHDLQNFHEIIFFVWKIAEYVMETDFYWKNGCRFFLKTFLIHNNFYITPRAHHSQRSFINAN